MIYRGESVKGTGRTDDFLDPGIAEFYYPSRFNVNKMIVLTALISTFKLSNIFSELVLYDQVAIEKKVNSIVECCPAHPVVLVLHEDIERFNVKMTTP